MFDIEKAKAKGIDPESIKIMQQIKENTAKRESCQLHDFGNGSRIGRYRCKNCGCEEDGAFVMGYKQGLEHGRGGRNGIERR